MANLVWKKMMGEMGSPCDGCENHDTCRDHERACEQFQNYVETGEIEKESFTAASKKPSEW